jgi:hypothetical protein
MNDCRMTSDGRKEILSPLGRAIRKFFGVPCVDCTHEITQQIEAVRSSLAKHNGRDKEVVEA